MKRRFTLIELMLVVSVIATFAFIAAALIDNKERQVSNQPPTQVVIPIGNHPEAFGQRIVTTVLTDGTDRSLVNAVSSWLKKHPGYRIETVTPADFSGGFVVHSYLLVASEESK